MCPAGELSEANEAAICDAQSKKRLASMLDILRRLGLIVPHLYSSNTFQSRAERSVFKVRPDVSFEEPECLTQPVRLPSDAWP